MLHGLPPAGPWPHAHFSLFLPCRVQELKLEEQQWQLDQELRWYIEKEGKRLCVLAVGAVFGGDPQPCCSPCYSHRSPEDP